MDPKKTEDGKIWARERFLAIIKEREYISSRINTSYYDTGKITPFERERIIIAISEENKKLKEEIDSLDKQSRK